MSTYISSSLTFESDKIITTETQEEVMMDWEAPIMSASAAYITQGGGKILEVGFGMGIASDYIQSHNISSHTIVENHPQVLEKLETWASGKSNVTIISQNWYDVKDSLGTFDGIFFDTYGDENTQHFSSSLSGLTKSGTKVTFWNNLTEENNQFNIPNVSYQQVSVTPDSNEYFNGNIYYLPKKEF
jgi:protein arginine N-methyltransferase 2